jgi:hypothetical protein
MIVPSSQTKNLPNIACTRLVGVATFSGNFPGSKRVPSKRLLLAHMAWLTESGALAQHGVKVIRASRSALVSAPDSGR